jgi:leucine-rich repeat/coiled-coil domain-containing protein 1
MDENNQNLSMIGCGIKSLKRIPLKVSLRSINFHSNQITTIENLNYLKNLVHLDLSSNKIKKIDGINSLYLLKSLNLSCNSIESIENLSGLKKLIWLNLSFNNLKTLEGLDDIWGDEYSLETLLLHNNYIKLVEQTFYLLSGLKKIKHLTLYGNEIKTYKEYLFYNLKSIISIDGKDKSNNTIKNQLDPSNLESLNQSNFQKDAFKQNIKILEENSAEKNPTNKNFRSQKLNDLNKSDINLKEIENNIHKLILMRNVIRKKENAFNNNSSSESDIEKSEQIRCLKKLKTKKDLSNEKSSDILKDTQTETKNNDTSRSLMNKNCKNNDNNYMNGIVLHFQDQINSHLENEKNNLKLIDELKKDLETIKSSSQQEILKKDEIINEFKNKLSSMENENKEMNSKIINYEKQLKVSSEKESLIEENIKKLKSKLKLKYQKTIDDQTELNKQARKNEQDKYNTLQESYRSLEEEFRCALKIESKRYNDLLNEYEKLNQECLELKSNSDEIEKSDKHNKTLISELNALIKEQKSKINVLIRDKKEKDEENKKLNEKLNETVNDCIKLKTLIDNLHKEKKSLVINLKKLSDELNDLRKEKTSWNNKLNEQKSFLMQESSRLEIENHSLLSEFDKIKREYEKQLDNVKIKSKIVEDQTETIKKLKNGIIERDDILKNIRENSLNEQKSLEKQLNQEINFAKDLKIKLEHSIERKEILENELVKLNKDYDNVKKAYEELSQKWLEKSNVINELDFEVRKIRENHELEKNDLMIERNDLKEQVIQLSERLRKIDDDFRYQYDIEKREHLKEIEKLKKITESKENESNEKIKEIENEMRLLLVENSNSKKLYEDKINNLKSLLTKIQQDI